MELKDITITLSYEKTKYEIKIERLLYMIRILKNDPYIEYVDKGQIVKLMRELKIFNKIFLKKASKI